MGTVERRQADTALAEELIALRGRLDDARRTGAAEEELDRIGADLRALLKRIQQPDD